MYQQREAFSPVKRERRNDSKPSNSPVTAHGRIAPWANNSGSFEEMIFELEKNYSTWVELDSTKFYEKNPERYRTNESRKSLEEHLEKCREANIIEIIKRLTKYKQINVLEYILKNERFISLTEKYKKQIKSNSKALSELVWINSRDSYKSEGYVEKIKQIFVLLMDFGFNFLQPESYGGDIKETLIDSLITSDNGMEEISKKVLYEFFTTQWFEKEKFLNELDGITCKMSNNTQNESLKIYRERLVFLISRNLELSLEKLFVMFMRKSNKYDIIYLIDAILSPVGSSCFDKYFQEINLSELRNN